VSKDVQHGWLKLKMNGSFVETETWTHICGFEEILQRKGGDKT